LYTLQSEEYVRRCFKLQKVKVLDRLKEIIV
jgi:hypothetical protein